MPDGRFRESWVSEHTEAVGCGAASADEAGWRDFRIHTPRRQRLETPGFRGATGMRVPCHKMGPRNARGQEADGAVSHFDGESRKGPTCGNGPALPKPVGVQM